MTDDRSRRFEQDLSTVLRQAAGDGAPAALRYRLADVTATPPLDRRSWFAPPLRWAAAAVAVIALAVLAFLLVPHENVGPTPTSSAQPTATSAPESGSPTPTGEASPTATPSVSPTPVPTPAPVAWSSLTWSVAAPAPGTVLDVAPWGSGFVGVGSAWDVAAIDAAFFTSADGTHWTLGERKQTAGGNVIVDHVVRMGSQLLAVGTAVMDGPGERPDFAPLLWMSNDGRSWTQLTSPTWDAALRGMGVSRLLAGPDGVLAVTLGTDPIVLYSRDGSVWTRSSLPASVGAIGMDAIAWSGGFVIVGRDGQPDHFSEAVINSQSPPGVGLPAAWTSADGVNWSQATVEGNQVAGAELLDVVAVRAGFLAVGVNSTSDFYDVRMTSWTSVDGQSWSVASGAQWPLGSGGYPTFAFDGARGVVLGWAPEGSTLAAWATTDGVAWTRLAFTDGTNAPVIDCARDGCVRIGAAWMAPDRIIVMATAESTAAVGGTVEYFWSATPGS